MVLMRSRHDMSLFCVLMISLSTPVSYEANTKSQYNNETETLNAKLSHNECLNIVKPKSSPKSKSKIQVPNPSPKFKIQSPEERAWDQTLTPILT